MTKRANPPALSRSVVQDNVPAMVTERLWIGSIHAAFNQDSMQDRGITHVLNASGLPATFPRQFTYFTVDIRDKESSNILAAIGAVNIFVEAGIEKGGVLVHCAGGRSRSAAFVVAFIMSTQGCSYDAAYAQVRRARPVASVNRGFEQQLRAYGAAQCDVFVAHQMMLRIRAATLLDRRNLLLLRRSSGGTSSETVRGGGEVAEHTKIPPPMPSNQPQHGATGVAGAGSLSTTGIPPTPRSPRGRGRSPAGANPATSYWQRRGSASGNGGVAVTTGVAAAAAAAAASVGKSREDQTNFLPKEPRPTRFRLCRPGAASVQVMPPLKTLERVHACRGCGAFLLTGGHIIKPNMDLPSLQAVLVRSSPRNQPDHHAPDAGASPLSLVTSNSPASNMSSTAVLQQSPPCGGSGSVGGGSSSACSGGIDTVVVRGRGNRRSPSPLSERRGQSRVTTATTASVSVSSGSPTTKRSGARRPPPPLRVITTEFGPDRPPMRNRWMLEGFLAGVPAATAAGPPLQGGGTTVGGGAGVGAGVGGGTAVAEAMRLHSPLGFTPSPNTLRPWSAGRSSSGAAIGGGGGGGWGCTGDSLRGDDQQNSTVFAFESEDDSSTVDPSEREGEGMLAETYPVAMDAFYGGSCSGGSGVITASSGGGGVSCSGSEGAGGGGGGGAGCGRLRRGGQRKPAAGTPPNAALQAGEFNLMLSSRMPVSAGSGVESVSPLMTPRSPRTPASCGSASPCASDGSFTTTLSRPQSVEKRQFLMRMNQMESRTPSSTGPSSYAETDSQTERPSSRPAGRWLHVDLLDWMGDIMAAPTGRICCPSSGCGVELGNWTWEKPEAAASKSTTGPPLIRLDKALIKNTSYTRSHLDSRSSLSRDSTPKSSPKSASAPSTCGSSRNSPSKGSSGILESRLAGLSASPQLRQHPRGSPPE